MCALQGQLKVRIARIEESLELIMEIMQSRRPAVDRNWKTLRDQNLYKFITTTILWQLCLFKGNQFWIAGRHLGSYSIWDTSIFPQCATTNNACIVLKKNIISNKFTYLFGPCQCLFSFGQRCHWQLVSFYFNSAQQSARSKSTPWQKLTIIPFFYHKIAFTTR